MLIPGTITQSSVLVEHPELVADRIVRFAGIVGRENVIAGADCGFGTFAGSNEIHESIVWAKLRSLAEGTRLATKQLWGIPGPQPCRTLGNWRRDHKFRRSTGGGSVGSIKGLT